MNTTKILAEDIKNLKVAAMPARPPAPTAFGGSGYTAAEVKAAFDRLPLYIAEKFNSLLDDIAALGDGSLAAEIPTGLGDSHSLSELFRDVENGNFASYMHVGDATLAAAIAELKERISAIEEVLQ